MITFWRDEEWKRELRIGGSENLYFLESRPTGCVHFSRTMFSKLEWDWPEEYSKRAWLGDHWTGGDDLLWIHPGSGSDKKNAPLSCFAGFARKWLDSKTMNKVAFSFGEADEEVWSSFEKLEIVKDRRVRVVRSASLCELRKMMVEQASVFLGNDSGPGHLAASLGILRESSSARPTERSGLPWVRGSKVTNRFRKPAGFCKRPNRPMLPNLR